MKDEEIIALYWKREEAAISATAQKYSSYCGSIAGHILSLREDVEECVNDTWLHAWNAIPPHKPPRLPPFLGKITRELAINRYKAGTAQKRGGGEYAVALEELGDFVTAGDNTVEREVELQLIGAAISGFLRKTAGAAPGCLHPAVSRVPHQGDCGRVFHQRKQSEIHPVPPSEEAACQPGK